MVFSIDTNKYRVIDISHTVVPGENPDRPFAIQRALLADQTFRYDILKTHSHVGTHVEVGAHFFDGGRTVTEYPLESFYGRGLLLSAKVLAVDPSALEEALGDRCTPGTIIVTRDDTGGPASADRPRLVPEGAEWLAQRQVKMLILDGLGLGRNIEEGRECHNILLSRDCTLVEIVANVDQITRPEFFVMALPYKVKGLDSSFVRAIVIEEK